MMPHAPAAAAAAAVSGVDDTDVDIASSVTTAGAGATAAGAGFSCHNTILRHPAPPVRRMMPQLQPLSAPPPAVLPPPGMDLGMVHGVLVSTTPLHQPMSCCQHSSVGKVLYNTLVQAVAYASADVCYTCVVAGKTCLSRVS